MLSNPKEEYTKSLWSVRSLIKPEETNEDYMLSIKNIDAAYGSSKVLKYLFTRRWRVLGIAFADHY